MTSDVSYAVHRLTEPWTLVLSTEGYKPQDFPPLLEILRGLVAPNSGRTKGGVNDPATRSVLDVKALTLLMHIEDVVGAWVNEWGIPTRGLIPQVVAVSKAAEDRWRTSTLTESDYLNITSHFQRWADQIWDLVEPPLQVPLRDAACPRCERAKWVTDEGEWVDNILVSYRDGGTVQAECRWRNCVGLWSGPSELRELGFSLGVQADAAALSEMGYEE